MTQRSRRTLVMTVGTGDLDRLEETLFTPLRKSIATDAWARVVLLPSSVTEDFARTLRSRLDGTAVEVSPLPAGNENDADAAYAHFDRVLAAIVEDVAPEDVVVDFTRGTKAMSAALVLAATRRAIPRLRYVTGRRDRRGMVEPGSEDVRGIRTTVVDGHRRLDLARELLHRGDFAAVTNVLPDPDRSPAQTYPDALLAASRAVRAAARFYAAWDRLDYASAAAQEVGAPPSGDWSRVWPTDAMRAWVTALDREPARADCPAMASWLRRLVVDLLANGERRIRDGHHEDAFVRAYRTLELVGQAQLFEHGLDSGNLDPRHEAVIALQRSLEKKHSAPLAPGRRGELQAGRQQVARLLKGCDNPLGARLLRFEENPQLKPTLRNNSVLVHGFAARAPADAAPLRGLFQDLEALLLDDRGAEAPEVADWLRIARSPAFDAA